MKIFKKVKLVFTIILLIFFFIACDESGGDKKEPYADSDLVLEQDTEPKEDNIPDCNQTVDESEKSDEDRDNSSEENQDDEVNDMDSCPAEQELPYVILDGQDSGRTEKGILYKELNSMAEVNELFPNVKEYIMFDNNVVIVLSYGQTSSTGCFKFDVKSIVASSGNMEIEFERIVPTSDCNCSAALASPYTFIIIHKDTVRNFLSEKFEIHFNEMEVEKCD